MKINNPFLRRNIYTLAFSGLVVVGYLIFFATASDCGSCSTVEKYRPAHGSGYRSYGSGYRHYGSGSHFYHK